MSEPRLHGFLRRRWPLAALVAAAMCAAPRPATAIEAREAAQEGGGPATFAVAIGSDGAPAWQIDALRRTLADDLAGPRLEPVDAAPHGCAADDTGCAIAHHAVSGVDIALAGQVDERRWRYQILLTWPGAPPPLRGTIELAGIGRRGLREAVLAALEPVLRSGGALDRRALPETEAEAARLPQPDGGGAAVLVLLLAALWLAAPLLAGVLLRIPVRGLRSTRRIGACVAALVIAAAALPALGERVPDASAGILIGGGLAWGWFAAAWLPHLLPPLPGFGHVEYGDLVRLLGEWVLLAVQRLVQWALLAAPVALLIWAVAWALGLPALVTLAVVAPVAGLLVRLWVRAWVELLAVRLDARVVDGTAGDDDPWGQAVRGYTLGYLRRAGAAGGDRLLDGVRFLPGTGDELHLYGGGLTHSRVVIPRGLLEYALAPYGRPHDYAAPRVSKLHWTEWNAGLIVPTEVGAVLATREDRQPRPVAVEGEIEEELQVGEPPTLAGWVEPYKLDRRDAHRPWEDPLWLDWDPGDEPDGTDASDRDFLFGLVVHQLGRIRRHEDRAATLGLAVRRWLARRPRLHRLGGRALAPLRPLLGRQPAVVGDAHAALNFARHHLIQYLAWQIWRRDDLLTARAHAPDLARASRAILRALTEDRQSEPRLAGPTPRRRLVWLSAFLDERLRTRSAQLWRRAALACLLLGGLAAAGVAVKQAVDYHPIYVDRMREQRDRLEPVLRETAAAGSDERQPEHGKEE